MRPRITMRGEMLLLAHTPNEAKQIEAQLRKNGHAIHVLVAPGLDSFADIIEKSNICIALHDSEFSEAKLIQAVEAVHRTKPELPVLQLNKHSDPRSITEAMRQGARGVISMGNMAHLMMLLQQEYETWMLHQQIRQLSEKIAQLEDVRVQDLGSAPTPGLRVQEGIVVQANAALASALSLADPDELIGYPLMDLVSSEDQPRIKALVKNTQKGRGSDELIGFTLQADNGNSQHIEARFALIEHEGELAIEIRAKEAIAAGAGDTGLDRTALITAIHQQAKTKSDNAIQALILVAIDEFADIEQRAGYAGAENLTAEAIQLIRDNTKANDKIFRFSLSELIILGQRRTLEDVRAELEHLQRSIGKNIFTAGDKQVQCSISVVVYPLANDPEDPQALLSKIHTEAQELQASGSNQLVITGDTAEELHRKETEMQWVEKVEDALSDNRFDLAYQNIASLAGEQRQFSDILLRMIDQDGSEVLARHFMPPAEKHGLLPRIDRWVFQRACEVIEKQVTEGADPCFFVRVAESTLAHAQELIPWLQELIGRHPKVTGHIVLVMREAHLQDHLMRAQTLVECAKSLGIATALDHFGTSRTSSELLSRLKLDYIKLHADFTQAIGTAGADMETLESLMEQARHHQVKTIAERVSDANSMARLWQMGVNYIMGSHVHEPERELTSTRFELA